MFGIGFITAKCDASMVRMSRKKAAEMKCDMLSTRTLLSYLIERLVHHS